MIKIKRVYDEPTPQDGYRVLVDRLWPRGVSKEAAAIDRWMKDVAPSDALRKWYQHDPDKWDEFRRRYAEELADRADEIAFLKEKSEGATLTLVYSSRETRLNNAAALREYLREPT